MLPSRDLGFSFADRSRVVCLASGERRNVVKPSMLTGVVLVGILVSGTVLADNDCTDPVSEWKPREALRQQLEQRGWTVQRIKVDDGCYEVRGLDRRGNKFRGKYSPASLRIRQLEIQFADGGEASDYLDQDPKTK